MNGTHGRQPGHLRLDPWAYRYEGSWNEAEPVESTQPLDLNAEVPAESWRAITPEAATTWPRVIFLDGSRRMEARAYLEDEAAPTVLGGLGTTAVGAVHVTEGRAAEFDPDIRVRRWCLLGSGAEHHPVELAASGAWRGNIRYEPRAVTGAGPEALTQGLQTIMREEERLLAARLASRHPDALVVCDGPLPRPAEPLMVGYLKTVGVARLPAAQLDTVRSLAAGQRSPVYLVGDAGGEAGFLEWWLRLRDPERWHFSLAGTVRLQVSAMGNVQERLAWALPVADWSCVMLPRLASLMHQDPRAPQQLLPIRALEAELRRRMGNPEILRRRLLAGHFAPGGTA